LENGIAKVSVKCKQTREGGHTKWESEKWSYINKKGEISEYTELIPAKQSYGPAFALP
jgi:hypothetical protein